MLYGLYNYKLPYESGHLESLTFDNESLGTVLRYMELSMDGITHAILQHQEAPGLKQAPSPAVSPDPGCA